MDRIDFLKLDTQGSEFDILSGAPRALQGCLGVEVEVMFHPFYDGQPMFADVDVFLRKQGFHLWRLDSLTHYMERPNAETRFTRPICLLMVRRDNPTRMTFSSKRTSLVTGKRLLGAGIAKLGPGSSYMGKSDIGARIDQ